MTFSPRSTRRDIKMRSKAWRRHAHATFFPYSARCAFVRVCKSAALHLLVMVRNYANRFQSPPLLFRVCICLHFAPSRNLHFARILFVVPRSPAGFGFLQDNFLFENLTSVEFRKINYFPNFEKFVEECCCVYSGKVEIVWRGNWPCAFGGGVEEWFYH